MDPRYAHSTYVPEQSYYPGDVVPYPDVARDASDQCAKTQASFYGYPTAAPGAFPSPGLAPGLGPGLGHGVHGLGPGQGHGQGHPYMVGYATVNKSMVDRARAPAHDNYGTLRTARFDVQVSVPALRPFGLATSI